MIVAVVISSCADKTSNKTNQGVITYNITYPEKIMDKGLSTFLPGEMTTVYKDNKFKIHISGEFNIYNLEYISRSNGDTSFTLLKILDKRLYYPQKEGENLFLFYKHDEPKITYFNDSTKVIAGFNCYLGTASFTNEDIADVRFYYTKEIDFQAPNANTPFAEVPGALLEFSVDYQGIDLSFKAKSVKLKEIKGDEFIVPKDYRLTDSNEINEIVSTLMQL